MVGDLQPAPHDGRVRRKADCCPPLLSNILLDDLDKELAQQGQRFMRYADDCNIYV